MKQRIRWENKNFDDMGTLKCLFRHIPHAHIVLALLSRLSGVDDPWLGQNLRISVLINTGPAAKL